MKNLLKRWKAALIDMDGVLYDSMKWHTLAWQRMMREIGVECDRDEFYLYEGMTGRATINVLFQRQFGHECDEERCRELYAVKSRYFQQMGTPEIIKGAPEMLAALGDAGLKRVLVTGSAQSTLLGRLDSDYPGVFPADARVTAHDVAHGKPDPEPYLKGAEIAGVDPSECIVVENAPLGVRAGKAAGCFTVAVTTGPIPREEFQREGADVIFPSMQAFAEWLGRISSFESRVVEADDVAAAVKAEIDRIRPDKTYLLTDTTVGDSARVWAPGLDAIPEIPEENRIRILPGELNKNLEGVAEIWEALGAGATRNSLLVNLGGGMVTDMGGFAAATFKRGIRFINVPTTVLGAVDAAIGGKTGFDFQDRKNEIGIFAEAERVIISPAPLSTLIKIQTESGFAEIVKMAMVTSEEFYAKLFGDDAPFDPDVMGPAMRMAAEAKEEICAFDPKESGIRRVLNFGHTAGHAIESRLIAAGTPITHGAAVAHGILVALRLSEALLGFPEEETRRYLDGILQPHFDRLPELDTDDLIERMRHDKKNIRSGEIRFTLLEAIGRPRISVAVPDALLRPALTTLY